MNLNDHQDQLPPERIERPEVHLQSQSRLLSLPAELREQIWIFYYMDHYKAKLFWRADGLHAKSCSSNLRLACRKVEFETKRVREKIPITLAFPDSGPAQFKHTVSNIGPLLKKGELFHILNRLCNVSVTMLHCAVDNHKSLSAFSDALILLCDQLPKVKRIEVLYRDKAGFYQKGTTSTQVHTRDLIYWHDLFRQGLYDDEFIPPASKIGTQLRGRDLRIYWTTSKEAINSRENDRSSKTLWGSVRFRVLPGLADAVVISRNWR